MATLGGTGSTYDFSGDSEDEFDWEEVAVPQAEQVDPGAGPSTRVNIEVTLEAYPAQEKGGKQKKPPGGISRAERLLRIDCHKVHTVALIANAAIRNRWINDELLQARLLSLTPLATQNSFAMIHKSRIPDDVKRGYLFEQAVSRLASWWADTFFTVKPLGHLRNRTFGDVQHALHSKGLVDVSGKGKEKAPPEGVDPLEDLFDDDEVEIVRSAKSLMKHALMRSGSRDVSSQLFTALCRALDVPARLVVSLQSVPWQTNVGRPKTPAKHNGSSSKGKGKAVELRDAEGSDEDMREVSGSRQNGHLSGDDMQVDEDVVDKTSPSTPNGKGKSLHTVKLRKSKSSGRMSGSPRPPRPSDPLTTPPVFWTEVFSRPDGRWIPVDPIRAVVNKRKVFDPTPVGTSSRPAVIDNRMMYVIAVEEDGYMRDVTPRYAKQYSAKVAKSQSGGGKGRREWWTQVMRTVTRPYRLHRDDVEDDELIVNQFTEGMPTTIGGFKDHPFYVLERHLHRDQIISQDAHELGKFRGETVYSRSQVLQLKAAENWMRYGRVVRTGEQPLKYVKQRAMTLNRRRELEIRADAEGANGSGDIMQGLYAERQTEIYVPPPVVDGKIPKNNFGNIDLYTPSMLPAGAAHIPHKGVAKIARQLGFDHAEAVTSFEFRRGKAFPVISGIVVAAENEDTILEGYWEAEHAAAQKEQEKRRQAVLKRWTKLVQGLRIRQRMHEQYGTTTSAGVGDVTPSLTPATGNDEDGEDGRTQPPTAGGFLTGVEDVVQPYSLPRPTHAVFSSPPRSPNPDGRASPAARTAPRPPFGTTVPDILFRSSSASGDDEDSALTLDDAREGGAHVPPLPLSPVEGEDSETEIAGTGTGTGTAGGAQSQPQRPRRRMPKSMAELAAEAAQAQAARDVAVADVAPPQMGLQEAPSASASASVTAATVAAPPSRTTRAASKAKAEPKSKPKPKPKPRMKTLQGKGRKRARAQDDDQDSDSNEDEGWESRSGAEPRVAAKRARKQRQDGLDPDVGVGVGDEVVLVPSSNRVLRTRKVTSPEQLAREREQELEVRRALAE